MEPARRTTLSLVTLACAVVLMGGCGGDDGGNSNDATGSGQTDDQQVRSVSTAYNSALLAGYEGRAGAGGYEKLCSLLTAQLRLEIAREVNQQTHVPDQCPQGWKILLGSVSSFASTKGGKLRLEHVKAAMRSFKIRSVRIRGNKATVTSTASFVDGEGGPTYLRKEDGKWLVDKQPAQAPGAATPGSGQNGG